MKGSGIGTAMLALVLAGSTAHAQGLFGTAHSGADGPGTLYSIDPVSGVATAIGAIGFERCSGMVFGANGDLFATCERSDGSDTHVLVAIDTATGAGIEVGPTGCGDTVPGLTYRGSTAELFAICYPGGGMQDYQFVSIDPATGAQTLIGPVGPWPLGNSGGNGLSFGADGTLYWATGDELYTIDPNTGTATFSRTILYPFAGGRTKAIDLNSVTGELFAIMRNPSVNPSIEVLATLDPASGTVTEIGQTTDGMDALAWEQAAPSAPIPTLSTFGLMALVLSLLALGLGILRSRSA